MFAVDCDPTKPAISFLSWDTEGGDRAKMNLLRKDSPVTLRARVGGEWLSGQQIKCDSEQIEGGIRYRTKPTSGNDLTWKISTTSDKLTMRLSPGGSGKIEALELVFPFDPLVTATTVIPSSWDDDGSFRLPALVSAPDFGQMLMSADSQVKGRLIGSRANHIVDLTLELPVEQTTTLSFTPVVLPEPKGLKDRDMWLAGRRGWFNMFQLTAQWGDQGHPFSAPSGLLANNVVSDAVSCLLDMWADHALLTPTFSREIGIVDQVRRTVDWWLAEKMRPSGEIYAYWDHADMLDANAGPVIASWDYVESSSDTDWLKSRIERLEMATDYMIRRDIDDDGIVESTHSGNYGTLIDPQRSDMAWDAINGGHKNAYCNAFIYRAFRCMADLEKQLGRADRQAEYSRRADRLRAQYYPTFYNPETGWLLWWRSEDDAVHDHAAPMITSLGICYGLLTPEQGRPMIEKLWAKVDEVGFKRFDLGLPITLRPVPKGDYLIGKDIPGAPEREDGSDAYGQYINGGCVVNDAIYFIVAAHIAGMPEIGDKILNAMLERQRKGVFPNGGGFQNGVVNYYPYGAEFFTWDGETTGYEGYLTYSFSFLQAILLRQPEFRARLFRPMMAAGG